jgi:predicted dithiol-disulfide oxidoreductase (DUF899 family)
METISPTIQQLEEQIGELKKQLREARLSNPGTPFADYAFESESGTVMLSELFGDGSDLLIWHNMGMGCDYCTLWADTLTGYVKHIETRCPVVVVTPDQVTVQQEAKAERGWNFRMVRDATHEFSTAAGFFKPMGDGEPWFWPGLSAFRKNEDGSITHVNATVFGPGDDFCPVWPALELLPGGIGEWEPNA